MTYDLNLLNGEALEGLMYLMYLTYKDMTRCSARHMKEETSQSAVNTRNTKVNDTLRTYT